MFRALQRSLSATAVAEIQGLYGPFSFPEKLLQKIWLRGDFNRAAAVTNDGRMVKIIYPGKWNLLGGPDFRGAHLRFGDGPEITGEVELHLHAADWDAHAHVSDPAYDQVVLHVVLFPPPHGHVTRGSKGCELPVLALLPLLHHDLEEFAAEDAVEALAGRAAQRIPEELFALESAELLRRLKTHAHERWRQKVHFANLRVQKLGWENACHHAALEILGYRFNRAPMLRIAGQWPLEAWFRGAIDFDAIFDDEVNGWQLQGVRPANHPRTRLRQYAAWTKAEPHWPMQLIAMVETLPDIPREIPTRDARRAYKLAALRNRFSLLTGDAIGGTRLDNLVGDGFLPLLAARTSQAEAAVIHALWCHWFPGDLPPKLARGLDELGICGPRAAPRSLGLAQGLLGWWLAYEARC